MGATLLIMAAGMGSRYGGNKQVDGLGPNGEILMEYSIYDAIRAGFDKVVFVIKPGMKETLAAICGDRIAKKVKVDYAFQDFSSVPSFYHIPEERTKPFGTVHAVLVARDYIDQPFAVINADDYYGVSAFSTIYEKLQTLAPEGEATMVGYQLQNTVSKNGTVSRGVCHAVNGNLDKVVETLKIKLCENGEIRDIGAGEPGELLDPLAPVSMNFWGFTPWIFGKLEEYFATFLKGLARMRLFYGEAKKPPPGGRLISVPEDTASNFNALMLQAGRRGVPPPHS